MTDNPESNDAVKPTVTPNEAWTRDLFISPEAIKELQSWTFDPDSEEGKRKMKELNFPAGDGDGRIEYGSGGYASYGIRKDSMTASEIVSYLEERLKTNPVNFDAEIQRYNWGTRPEIPLWLTETNGLYYRMLAKYGSMFQPKAVCEVGTCYGSSAMALSKFNPGTVTTYDIDLSKIVDQQIINDFGIKTVLLKHPNDCEAIPFHEYDTLFLDIGDHNGLHERRIHERLVREGWKGVVFWDDINWGGMRPVWDAIQEDKCATNWHGESGYGVVVLR